MTDLERAWCALAGWATFAVVALGWRAWLQYKRTGSTGFVGMGRTWAERIAGSAFTLAIAASIAAPLFVLLGVETVASRLPVSGALVGLCLFLAGLAGTVWSQLVMGDSWRVGVKSDERTNLVTHGPFRWVRNPIFSCTLLCALGSLLFLPNVVSMSAGVVLFVAVEMQVRVVEEPHLVRNHREAYLAYARKVGRFLPYVGRLQGDPP